MTDHPSSTTPPSPRARGRPPLYRAVLGLAIAALLAAWLPFTVMYVSALDKRATAAAVVWKSGHPVITTRTSGGQVVQTSAPAATAQRAQATVPVTTRSS